MKYPKLRHFRGTAHGRTMENATKTAMKAVERAMSEDGGWTLVCIEGKEMLGRWYDRKTDSYLIDAWLVQYPKSKERLA